MTVSRPLQQVSPLVAVRAVQIAGKAAGWAVFVALMMVLGLLLPAVAPAYFGYHQTSVLGSSMGDALPIGSVAVTRTVDASQVAVGDIIIFGDGDNVPPVLHRVIAIEDTPDGRLVTTKGDANATPDPDPQLLVGRGDRVVYHVPWAGYLLVAARSTRGQAVIGAGVAILLVTMVAGPRQGRRTAPAPAARPLAPGGETEPEPFVLQAAAFDQRMKNQHRPREASAGPGALREAA